MSYIDGFVIAVPTANKQKFIEHARKGDTVFTDLGATRVVECWADDVPDGKITDFRKAVQAKADESVVFSWIEWPDKETRDAAMKKMMSEDFKYGEKSHALRWQASCLWRFRTGCRALGSQGCDRLLLRNTSIAPKSDRRV